MQLVISGITVALGLSSFLLYTRKRKWNTDKFRWILTGIPFGIGLIGILLVELSVHKDSGMMFLNLMVPLVYNFFDRLFKRLSQKQQKRDFYLYLSNSSEISSRPNENPHVTELDMTFSFGLLTIIILLTTIPMLILKEEY